MRARKTSRQIVFGMMIAAAVWLCSCDVLERKHQAGAAVEISGQYLYRSTLDSLTIGLSPADSIHVAQQYIAQWAKDALMYDYAKQHADKQLEALVEEYRRSLYVHHYEEYLIERRMPKAVPDSAVQQLYDRMPDRFVLDESIVKGVLLTLDNNAPKMKDLRKWMEAIAEESEATPRDDKEENVMDNIEKYAYQNASGYELFTDRWLTTSVLLTHIPIERAEMEAQLKRSNHIEVSDSLKTYMLQVTDKYLRGGQMPIEYARPEIERLILSGREQEFVRRERERLYNEGIQNGHIRFYE